METTAIIEQACTEDWGKMTTSKYGKHCALCQKEVWDFTQKSKADLQNALRENANICIRARKDQVKLMPNYGAQSRLARFLVALLFVFGFQLFSWGNTENDLITHISENTFIPTTPPDSLSTDSIQPVINLNDSSLVTLVEWPVFEPEIIMGIPPQEPISILPWETDLLQIDWKYYQIELFLYNKIIFNYNETTELAKVNFKPATIESNVFFTHLVITDSTSSIIKSNTFSFDVELKEFEVNYSLSDLPQGKYTLVLRYGTQRFKHEFEIP